MTFGDLDMPIGDTAQWTGTVLNSSRVPVSLSGLTVTFSGPFTKVLSQPGGTGVVQLGPLATSDTSGLSPGVIAYRILVTDGVGGQTTVEQGLFTLIGPPNV